MDCLRLCMVTWGVKRRILGTYTIIKYNIIYVYNKFFNYLQYIGSVLK